MKHMKILTRCATAAVSLGLVASAQAALVTDAGLFAVVEDFSSFDGLVTTGPELLAGGSVSVVSSIESTLGAFGVDLVENGTWGAGNKFAGIGDLFLNTSSSFLGSMTFSWNEAVKGVAGLFSIYQLEGGNEQITIEALGTGGTVLETYLLGVNLANPFAENEGSYAGILRGSADIYGLRVSGDGFVMDDLSVAPVPVPAALPLLISGIAGFAAFARRRRARVA